MLHLCSNCERERESERKREKEREKDREKERERKREEIEGWVGVCMFVQNHPESYQLYFRVCFDGQPFLHAPTCHLLPQRTLTSVQQHKERKNVYRKM